MSSPLPPAGWFADPADATRQRWWDGTAWTDQLHAPPAPVVDAPGASVPLSRRELRAQLGGALTYGEEPAVTTTATAVAEPEPEPAGAPASAQAAAPAAAAPEPAPEPAPAWPPAWAPSWATEATAAPVAEAPAAATAAAEAPAAAPWAQAPVQQSFAPSPTPSQSYSRYDSPATAFGDFGPLGTTETPGAWLLALTPLLFVGLSIVITVVSADGPGAFRLAGIGLVVALSLRFARMDVATLQERRYPGAPNSWFAIIPLAYFIARVVMLGTGAMKLLFVHIGVLLVATAVAIWFVFAVVLAPVVPEGYKVLNGDERAAMLSPAGAAAQLEFDFEYVGDSEVSDVVCQPFPSHAAGSETSCSLVYNEQPMNVIICITPEEPLVAFIVCGGYLD